MKCNILLFIISICILDSCSTKSNRVYFSIDPEDRKILIPIQFNDSIAANMGFDLGCSNRVIYIDSLWRICESDYNQLKIFKG